MRIVYGFTLTILMLCMAVMAAHAERAYFLVPMKGEALQFPTDSLTYTIAKVDTVLRDSLWQEMVDGKLTPRQLRRLVTVPRVVGGYALVASRQIDSVNSLALVMVYTRPAFITRLENDTNYVLLSRADTVERTDNMSTAFKTRLRRFYVRNGVPLSRLANWDWLTYGDLWQNTRRMLQVTTEELRGCDITRRED